MSSVQGAGAHVWACGPMEVEIRCRRRSRNSPGVPPLPGLPQPCDVALKEPVPPRPSPVPPAAPTDLPWAGAHRATPPTKRDFSVPALWNTGTEHPTTFPYCTLWSHASEDRPHGHSRKPNVNVEPAVPAGVCSRTGGSASQAARAVGCREAAARFH
ncbi:RNA-binding protein 26-like isoform X2 [Panthera leo]|uniref:RNA-binding protein 26-like isoform X2 n=1 Tax=Panthera leo TaxID=9689 RepID=UPI001C69E0A5|nr:RNA-binding protein 26-like isoform X2 [Panthera leo]